MVPAFHLRVGATLLGRAHAIWHPAFLEGTLPKRMLDVSANIYGQRMIDPESTAYMEQDPSWREGRGGTLLTIEVEQQPTFQLLLLTPAGPQEGYDLSTFRVDRHGGATSGDRQYARNVFMLLGAMTFAAGHIEAEMKRIILVSEELATGTFADVPSTWSGLWLRLDAVADGEGPYAQPLRAALDWGNEHNVTAIRHTAVHSAWWRFDPGHVHLDRFQQKQEGQSQMGTWEEVGAFAETLFEFLDRLTQIVKWPMALLPPIDQGEQVVPVIRVEPGPSPLADS